MGVSINDNYNKLRSKEEHSANSAKGGVASGVAKRARKALKEELILLLENGDTQKNISVALINKALDGDIKAFEVLRDTIGEKPSDKVEMKADVSYENLIKDVVDKDEY